MFKIYKDDTVIAKGKSPLAITGIEPNRDVKKGEYQVVRVDGDTESDRVDVPDFKTLPINVTGVTLSPKTSNAEAGTEGNRQLSATVDPTDATDKNVIFKTEDVEGLTVSPAGKLEWTADTPEGTYTTTVTTTDGQFTDTHTLTLEEEKETDPIGDDDEGPESIEVNPKEHTFIDIWEPGTSKRFNVTILPEDADQSYTVESSDTSVIRAGKEGMQAVGTAMKSGTATLTITTANDLSAKVNITVPEQG